MELSTTGEIESFSCANGMTTLFLLHMMAYAIEYGMHQTAVFRNLMLFLPTKKAWLLWIHLLESYTLRISIKMTLRFGN